MLGDQRGPRDLVDNNRHIPDIHLQLEDRKNCLGVRWNCGSTSFFDAIDIIICADTECTILQHDHVDKYHIRPYFLDATHIVVVHNTTLRIHEVSPTRQIRDSLVCTLELPALKAKKQPHDVRSCLQFPLSHLDEPEAPLFECDPSLTLLVLRFSACSTPSWQVHLSHQCKEFLALVPVSTMLA